MANSVGKFFRRHRWLLWVSGAFLVLLLGGWLTWNAMVCRTALSESEIACWTPSVKFYDGSGTLVHVETGAGQRWNFPIPYEEIPKELIRYVLAVEDRGFWEHSGVDWKAVCRASWQLLTNGHIVSGASTVTMQTMTMFTGRQRTLGYKFRQALLACNWEKSHSKEEILGLYLNHLPYGGQLYGVEAAARYYFGRSVGELNRSEMVLLAGLPQSPSRFRPDKHPVRAVQRRDVVLHLLVKNGAMTPAEAEEIRHEPLRYRDFQVPAWPRMNDTHFLQLAQSRAPGRTEYHLSLNMSVQAMVRETLKREKRGLSGVKDGAAVVIENSTGEVRALLGTLDFDDSVNGAVNAAVAWRSPGSALKPFLYGEALYGGMITAETRLLDERLLLEDYRPENFDGTFRGAVSAKEALADSLNTTAVLLLQQVGVERVLELLADQEILRKDSPPKASEVGLSLAIGGTESNLLALAAAYSRLAGAPGLSFCREEGEEATAPSPPWTPEVRQVLLKMLRCRPIPGGDGMEISWKTGTSNGNRDAWCFAVTPEWTVGVWFGNKDGKASPALVGATTAAPAAAAILRALYSQGEPLWKSLPGEGRAQLCAESGLAMGEFCKKSMQGTHIPGVALRTCDQCARKNAPSETRQKTRILAPQPGAYLCNQISDATQQLAIRVMTEPAQTHCYVDGAYLGLHETGEKIILEPGEHRLVLWGGQGWESTELLLKVRENPALSP